MVVLLGDQRGLLEENRPCQRSGEYPRMPGECGWLRQEMGEGEKLHLENCREEVPVSRHGGR